MSIKAVIKRNVLKVDSEKKPFTFGFGNDFQKNADADSKGLPVMYLDSPIRSTKSIATSGYKKDEYPVLIAIGYKSERDWLPNDHDKVIQRARKASNRLIDFLLGDENVESIKGVNELEFEDFLDVNLSGVFLTMTVTLRNEDTICID